jgi:magnesium chelatase subunit H
MNTKTNIVAVVGLEHFNKRVWDTVRGELSSHAEVHHFTEFEVEQHSPELAQALESADCVFVSMINFKEQADWLREKLAHSRASTVFAYESMPEVMSLNHVGDYVISGKGGMPEPLKKIVRLLVNGRDEDTLYGYTKLMKMMQTMMRFMPEKAKDFKNWMQVNIYWNQPVQQNVTSMFKLILREYFGSSVDVPPVVEVPTMGLYHPNASAPGFFRDIKAYRDWQKKSAGGAKKKAAVVKKPKAALLFFRKHLMQERSYIDDAIRALEAEGVDVLPIFVSGIEGHVVVREWLVREGVDVLISMIGFALVGGPAGSTKPGHHKHAAEEILRSLNVPYIVAQPLYVQDFKSWAQNGVGPMQSAALYALPEMDGAIDPVVLGAINDGKFVTVPDRLARLSHLVRKWAELRGTPNRTKKVAFVVYDYPPGLGKKGTAALLDVPRSLLNMLRRLEQEGYDVGTLPESAEQLMHMLDEATDVQKSQYNVRGGLPGVKVTQREFNEWTTLRERERVEERWGHWPGEIAPAGKDAVYLGGLQFGNVYIGVQPRIGVTGDPMRLLFDKENTPHHQYLAFYRWLSRGFGAQALVHVGMHGSAEWMPGLQLGATRSCWPDALLGEIPHLYVYPMNNPSESSIAKRRGYATIVSHAVPPMTRAGLYKELAALREMLTDYREAAGKGDGLDVLAESIERKAALAGLDNDCPRRAGESFAEFAGRLYAYVRELESRLITNALHTFGDAPPIESQVVTVTEALKARGNGHSLGSVLLRGAGVADRFHGYGDLAARARRGESDCVDLRERIDEHAREFVEWTVFGRKPGKDSALLREGNLAADPDAQALARAGRELARLLGDNRGELDALVNGLAGRYIAPAPGGDLIRDGADVLPTGRNIHAIDPWRIPSELAYARGSQVADAILARHVAENGAYPETVAQVLWGLDTIKTKGESVACVLRFLGARPEYDGQGKISHYGLIPLEELGRPRIDVLMNLSPIFRDTFENLMDHLDRLVRAAAQADEPEDMNFVKKHVASEMARGVSFDAATARLFTQAQGNYGTYVDDMVEDSAWEKDDDLDQQFIRRNSYAYGGGRSGEKAPEMLKSLLGTVGRVVQEVDSVEFGVADIDHYFSSSGALHLAARKRNTSGDVKLNYVETYTADTKIDDVDTVLRVEYRTKLLNPRWYEGMLKHGHSGATEISNRFTYMLGWDAVSGGVDDWVYTQAAQTYALDPQMRERLEKANPQAMRNIVGRLLEASGRGLWKADDDVLDQLREMYADLEDRLEGIKA